MRGEQWSVLVRSISELWGKRIELTEDAGAEGAIAVGPEGPALLVRGGVGEGERRAILEIASAVARAEATAGELVRRLGELEERAARLAAENAMLAELAVRDALTGLYNRGYLLEKLDAEINRATRFGMPLSVLMVDLDHFKEINDRYGHAAGDRVLRVVGSVLRESCRMYDVPGRYGGEEFCLMLPSTELEPTVSVADRIRRRIEGTAVPIGRGAALSVTASIGVAAAGAAGAEDVFDPGTLLDRADRALYRAKNSGRNRIEVWAGGLPGNDH